jgi:hypothetical protein
MESLMTVMYAQARRTYILVATALPAAAKMLLDDEPTISSLQAGTHPKAREIANPTARAHVGGMGEVTTKTATAKRKRRASRPLVHRGVVIQRPVVPPSVPLERIMRAARIAFDRQPHDLVPTE